MNTMNLSRPGRPGANRSAGVFGWNIFLLTCALAVSSAGRAWAQQDAAATPATPAVAAPAPGDDRIRLNFRGVSLDMVLEYLSEAAGFIIIKETEVKGKVDVWSNQPLTKEEAIEVLNTVLNKHDYAAIRNGRTLTIVSRDDAKKRDIPVKRGAEAEEIPKSDQMVTQVVPVSRANATQLVNNLRPLLGTYAEMTVNESANTLVITATQADIKRMAEIINALDESISSTSSIKVHPLRYADAKEIATVVRDVFAPAATQQNNNQARTQFGGFGGGFPGAAFGGAAFGGGGGAGGAGGAAGGAGGTGRGGAAAGRGGSSGGAQTVRVVAVADERSNSVIVGAPPDLLPTITGMIGELDQEVNDITELRVFTLKNSDATEVANLLTSLFPDETQTSGGGSQPQLQFNRGGFGGRSGGTAAAQSQRMKKQGRVLAVPDARTGSVIVSAASEMMPQIADMIAQLDGSGARKQKVFVYSLENADPQQVGQIVQDMFQRNTTTANRNTANQNSALSSRIQSNNQALSTGTGNTGLGTTGFGNTGLGGGRTR